jgi:hypothetical protein
MNIVFNIVVHEDIHKSAHAYCDYIKARREELGLKEDESLHEYLYHAYHHGRHHERHCRHGELHELREEVERLKAELAHAKGNHHHPHQTQEASVPAVTKKPHKGSQGKDEQWEKLEQGLVPVSKDQNTGLAPLTPQEKLTIPSMVFKSWQSVSKKFLK